MRDGWECSTQRLKYLLLHSHTPYGGYQRNVHTIKVSYQIGNVIIEKEIGCGLLEILFGDSTTQNVELESAGSLFPGTGNNLLDDKFQRRQVMLSRIFRPHEVDPQRMAVADRTGRCPDKLRQQSQR